MKINSFKAHYNLAEFHHYINMVDENCVSIVELLIELPFEEFNKDDFEDLFIIETEKQSYVFSNYIISEYFEENGMTKIVYVK